MIVYHGTTAQNAADICATGFLPRNPSRKVWFTESKDYALRRAKNKARSTGDKPVVLTCNINIDQMRKRSGSKRAIFYKNGIIAVAASVPATVLRSHTVLKSPSSPEELVAWLNRLLGLKSHEGISRRHPGVERLSDWMANRLNSGTGGSKIRTGELLQKVRQWLPDFFGEGVEINFGNLGAHSKSKTRKSKTLEAEMEFPSEEIDTREHEKEALDCLAAQNPKRRIRGLKLLAEIETPNLFDWCVMLLDDEFMDVQVATLHVMLCCDKVDTEVILPLAESENKRVRAAAIAVLAKHSGGNALYWFELALKDKSACVRLETVSLLSELDTEKHRHIFELALRDSNPRIKHIARKLTVGKGFKREMRMT